MPLTRETGITLSRQPIGGLPRRLWLAGDPPDLLGGTPGRPCKLRAKATVGGRTMGGDVIHLSGIHHLKLPVRDLARTEAWYHRVLGYRRAAEFVEDGVLMGVGTVHPAGGPDLAFRLDPNRAEAAAGFDYFSIGVPDKATIEALAARLDELEEPHGGVRRASRGWVLPYLHDPDGHEVRFYTIEHHTADDPDRTRQVRNAGEILDQAKRAAGDER
jgi:catechol 2,3-dioxygenase-like lactoylglutathione lyase family enzyme